MGPTPYPSRAEIQQLCGALDTPDGSPFFRRVSPTVVWDVMGTHPAAGRFTSLDDWKRGALGVMERAIDGPLTLKVVNVVGGGEQEWAVVELEADAICKSGMRYPQRYAWVMRFDEDGIIVQVRAYLDSALVQKAVDSNQ